MKTQLQRLIRQKEAERRANNRHTEKHFYECIYGILPSTAPETEKIPALQRNKAKLVCRHAARRIRIFLDTHEHDKIDGEELSLFHILTMHRRREVREIRQVTDSHCTIYTTLRDITANFVSHLSHKYKPIDVDGPSIHTA